MGQIASSGSWAILIAYRDSIFKLQPSSICHFERDGTQGRGEDVPFADQPLSLGCPDQCCIYGWSQTHRLNLSLLRWKLSFTPCHPTGGTGLRLDVILDPRSHVAPWSVDRSSNRAHLPANVFRSLYHDMDLGGDDMAPLEHHLVSGPSLSPHPSLDVT